MPTTGQGWSIAGLLIVAVAVVAAAMLPGDSVRTMVSDQPPGIEDLSATTALVGSKRASGGLKVAGVRLQEKTYRLDLIFLAASDCDPSPPTDGADESCAGPDGLIGEAVGVTINGDTIAVSRVEVARQCYHAIGVADPWPSVEKCKVIVDN